MTSLLISLFATAVIALVCSLFCHYFIKSYWPANIATVVYTLLIFHGLAYLEAGYIDPNWLVSSALVSGVSLPVALLTGVWITERRRLKQG